MAKMKWDINGKGQGAATGAGNNYSGPNLPRGSWTAKIKRMEVTKIQSAANKNKPRIRILLEVTGMTGDKAKYNGHPIWDGLNIIPSSVPFVNGFLHALTDGSERQKRAIEAAFWDEDKGPDYKRVENKKSGTKETHITKIGRVRIDSPNGETLVQVTTKPGEYKGDYRAEVTGYIPFDGKANSSAADEDSDDDDVDDGLGDDADDDDDDIDADDADDDSEDEDDEDEDDEDEDEDDEDEDDEDEDDEDEDEDDDEPVTAGSGRRSKPF
ncbi:hypothetical protein SEA_LEOPARD_76 [Mycobacterium phage Leopard]|nr:hypothetical protein SEA_LEOPARD_76 [Mycobacterium phage Leopard]